MLLKIFCSICDKQPCKPLEDAGIEMFYSFNLVLEA